MPPPLVSVFVNHVGRLLLCYLLYQLHITFSEHHVSAQLYVYIMSGDCSSRLVSVARTVAVCFSCSEAENRCEGGRWGIEGGPGEGGGQIVETSKGR